MIEMGHIGVGALAGRECSGPLTAFIAGIASHALMDVAPHGEINDQGFEIASTAVGLGVLAAKFGPTSPILWGAIGGVLPDAEHVLPSAIKPQSPVFPTHFIDVLHASDTELSIPAWAQVVLGGCIVGMLVFSGRTGRQRSSR